MDSLTISTLQVEALAARIGRLGDFARLAPRAARKGMFRAIRIATRELRKEVRNAAPKATGRLRRSARVRFRRDRDGGATIYFQSSVPYAFAVDATRFPRFWTDTARQYVRSAAFKALLRREIEAELQALFVQLRDS